MYSILLLLACCLFQDTPTPGGKPVPPEPPEMPARPDGGAATIGFGTGMQSSGDGSSEGKAAGLGLRVTADISGTEHGVAHAIAGVRKPAKTDKKTPTHRDEKKTPTLPAEKKKKDKKPGKTEATPEDPSGEERSRIIYGFTAVVDGSLLNWLGGLKHTPKGRTDYLRAELYLYVSDEKKEEEEEEGRGTRPERKPPARNKQGERFYHAVLERGRIVQEEGDRNLLKEFASYGPDAWFRPFQKGARRLPKDQTDKTEKGIQVVRPLLTQAVRDLTSRTSGKPKPRWSKMTRVWRDPSVRGVSGSGRSGSK